MVLFLCSVFSLRMYHLSKQRLFLPLLELKLADSLDGAHHGPATLPLLLDGALEHLRRCTLPELVAQAEIPVEVFSDKHTVT